jgi:hypothetical protein
MMDRVKLQERYLQDEWPRQVGNLASTLTRLSSRARDVRYDRIVADLLNEGALMIEWCAPNVPLELATELATMQRELILWRQIWPSDAARALLAFRARDMADRLLQGAGLLE